MFRSNGLVAVEALKSMHNTFLVCFPHVGAVTVCQWLTSPRRCASRAPSCCHAGLAMCRGNSHGCCHVRPPLLPCGHATLPPALRVAVLPCPPCIATCLLPLPSHPCAHVCAAMVRALARYDSVHVVAPTIITSLMALQRAG